MSEQQPDVVAQLKRLRLYGIAAAWADLSEQAGQPAGTAQQEGHWLVKHLLRAEVTDRAMRSVNYQMGAARSPAHRDMAGFDFESSKVERRLIDQLAEMAN